MTQAQLKTLQPDLQQWIEKKHVSLKDVANMTEWQPEPLHPIKHFNANLLDLLENRYPPDLLIRLGIDYSTLANMHMTPEIMRLFKFSLRVSPQILENPRNFHLTCVLGQDWKKLGLAVKTIDYFTDQDISNVFETSRDILIMQMSVPS